MYPRWHILYGAIFTGIIWYFAPDLNPLYLVLLFLATFLIDFDHYVVFARDKKTLSIPKTLKAGEELRKIQEQERKKGIKKRGPFFLFHTIEFHVFVALLSFFWTGFFYIFLGMIFHSLLDLIEILYQDALHKREYFMFNWVRTKFIK